MTDAEIGVILLSAFFCSPVGVVIVKYSNFVGASNKELVDLECELAVSVFLQVLQSLAHFQESCSDYTVPEPLTTTLCYDGWGDVCRSWPFFFAVNHSSQLIQSKI